MKINPFNYVWRYHDAHQNYSDSYNQGYLDGQRVSHDVYSTQRASMNHSYEQQLHQLE